MVLPRVFGLFFNQNQNQVFTDKSVIKAINQAINKEAIVKDVLLGYGKTIENPIPESLIPYNINTTNDNLARKDLIQKIQNDLAKAGWKKGEDGILEKVTIDKKKKTTKKLTFSISTGNTTELVKTADQIKNDLLPLGIQVDIKTFDTGNLNQNVIRPRKYDALLFGEIINHESDLFAFWHSSQRRDPGLNVAMYTNAKVDKILEDAFVTVDDQSRNKKYLQFEDEIRKDMPAVFLYSPDFIYIMPDNIKNFERTNIISPGDRYLNIYSWYINTENVWKIFAKK
jgi:peptide/nickel transport system substrate-binding protein